MENTTVTGKGIAYSPYLIKDKHYFGGYFNLALNNIQNVIEEFNKRTGKKGNSLNGLKEAFKPEMSFSDYERYVHILGEYLPITAHLDKAYLKDNGTLKEISKEERIVFFRDMLCKLINLVNSLRDFYSHHHHNTITIDPAVFAFLDTSLITTVADTKENYLKTDKTKQLLNVSLKEELDLLCREKTAYLKQNNIKFDRKDKNAIVNAVYNDAFKNFVYKKEDQLHLTDFKKSRIVNTGKMVRDFDLDLSVSGIVYLLSMFLSRKEIELFKGNIKGFKASVIKGSDDFEKNSIHFMATHRIYSVHAYKGLKKKIRATHFDAKQMLLMQLLDELSKVPHEVYKHLDTSLQNSFIEDWNEYFMDHEENGENLENSRIIHPVIRKRYEDKFSYFALRFLDTCIDFPSLRFQVHMGHYVHHKMEKQLVNGKIVSDRAIKEKITVFARLDDVNKAKNEYFNAVDSNEEEGWEYFPNPAYDFPKQHTGAFEGSARQKNAGKIGIYLHIKNSAIQQKIQEAKARLHPHTRHNSKSSKQQIIEKIIGLNANYKKTPVVYTGAPLAYLSVHDLHAILYDLLVKGKTAKEVEDSIEKQFVKQLSEIEAKDTSVKILKKYAVKGHISGINVPKLQNDLVKEKDSLISLYDEHRYRVEDFEKTKKSRSYPHKRNHILFPSEKGRIAVWLANDIKRFMPQSFKLEWKGYQHSELQRLFAYYETNHKLIEDLLQKAGIKDFPFNLYGCLQKNTLEDFYPLYLERRIDYIAQLVEQLKNFKEYPKIVKKVTAECFRILKQHNYKQCGLDEQVQRLLATPVLLERGFLDEKPTMLPGVAFSEHKELFAGWFIYYKENKNYQKFYNTEQYPLTCNDEELYKINSHIKKQQKNDVFALLMARKLFKEVFHHEAGFALADLYQSRSERLQNSQYARDTQQRNENFIWNKPVALGLLAGRVTIPDVKLKDIGNFKAYETDQRVKAFLAYDPGKRWHAYLPNNVKKEEVALNVIECQLQNYEYVRAHKLLKEVQVLEQYIYEKTEDKTVLKQSSHENFRNYILNGLYNKDVTDGFAVFGKEKFENIVVNHIKEKAKDLEKKLFILTFIRNKFCHNQLPDKKFYDFCRETVAVKPDCFYGDFYLEVFKNIIDRLEIPIYETAIKNTGIPASFER